MITWTPIEQLPDELKDGRTIFLWTGTSKDGFHIEASWHETRWTPAGEKVPGWVDDGGAIMCEVNHFAEITPP